MASGTAPTAARIGYILIIAILGTSISVVVVAQFLMYTAKYHNIKDA